MPLHVDEWPAMHLGVFHHANGKSLFYLLQPGIKLQPLLQHCDCLGWACQSISMICPMDTSQPARPAKPQQPQIIWVPTLASSSPPSSSSIQLNTTLWVSGAKRLISSLWCLTQTSPLPHEDLCCCCCCYAVKAPIVPSAESRLC